MPDLFSILCTTCKTKLRVRDPAVVGQILACPKCSSMVLVEAPPGWAPPLAANGSPPASESNGNGSGQAGSAILGKSPASSAPLPVAKAIASSAAAPARKPVSDANQTSLKETVSDSHFADVEALFGGEAIQQSPVPGTAPARPKPHPEQPKQEKRRNTPAPPPPAEMVPPAVSPPAKAAIDPASGRTRRIRMLALLTVGGLMGISLAISAAYFAATWGNKPKEVAQQPPPAADASPMEPVEPDSTEPDPIEPDGSDPDDAPPSPPLETDPPDARAEAPTDTARTDTASTEAASTEAVPPTPPDDPLKIANDQPRDVDNPADLRKLEDQFKGLETDSGPGLAEAATSEEPAPEAPATTEEPAAPPSRSRPEPRKVDLAARLADRIVEVEFTGQALSDVLHFLSDFSTIPITLDPDALAWSRITPAAPVKAKMVNATLEEVLAEVLKPFRLEAQKLEDQLIVTRSDALRKIKCPIDDLAGGDPARLQHLIEMITALAAPESWKSVGGLGSLTPQGNDLLVENTELAYGEVLHVCERLRQARGGRTKSVFSPELFALERRTARAAPQLDLPLTLNFGQPTLLVKILDRFAEETGTQIVVDWQAAGEIGWPPDADATVTLDKTPLREALEKLLTPMDLTYRVIDAKTLQVTTPAALERKAELEAYQAGDLAATPDEGTALLERITSSLGDAAVLRWDAPSKTLLARLPQPQQEQLAALLAQWRDEAAAATAK
jgi:hypothetical protein